MAFAKRWHGVAAETAAKFATVCVLTVAGVAPTVARDDADRALESPRPSAAVPRAEPSAQMQHEIEELQRELGGKAVDRFPSLRSETDACGKKSGSFEIESTLRANRRAVAALREVAQDLDLAANRFELLELYAAGDELRETAQKLRRTARGLANADGQPAVAPALVRSNSPPQMWRQPARDAASTPPARQPSQAAPSLPVD